MTTPLNPSCEQDMGAGWERQPDSYQVTRNCERCGTAFRRQPNRSNKDWANKRFCSRICTGMRTPPDETDEQKFLKRAIPEPNTGCWIWTASLSSKGYGWFWGRGRKRMHAHRFSLEAFKGQIPSGLFACHTCDNRWCVNPDHLYAGTASENTRDSVARGRHRTQRRLGHE